MSENQYPVFEGGQTLTAAELNGLRAFLHGRDRLMGRMTGFGVNCGLGGVVVGTSLTVRPGLAVDQRGEPLVLAEPERISLAPPAMIPSYDFIVAKAGGFSVVLEATDTVEPARECGEENCAGHAELHTRSVAVRTVAGRLTGTGKDLATEKLLKSEPIRLALDATPINSFSDLRDAVADRLTNGKRPVVDRTLIAQLRATSIASEDSAGTKGYKCGWLNMVLFATLDLLRVEALVRVSCDRPTATPGVVLGWVHQTGSAWVFDCAYRHAWEPPRGLTDAYLGGTCTDPAGRYREELEALLAGYAPPESVPTGTIPEPQACPRGSIRVRGQCINVVYPPPLIPEKWRARWEIDPRVPIDPRDPLWNPPYEQPWREPWRLYETEGWDQFQDGVFGADEYVGRPAIDVEKVLKDFVTDRVSSADIRVLTHDEAQRVPGYQLSGAFSPSDTVVLSVDAAGTVVATGRVAALRNTRVVGTALPAAMEAVGEVQRSATDLKGLAKDIGTKIEIVDSDLVKLDEGLSTVQKSFSVFQDEFDHKTYAARMERVELSLNQEISDQLGQFARKFELVDKDVSKLQGAFEVLQHVSGRSGVRELSTPAGIDKALGQGVVEFAATTLEAMRSLPDPGNPNFQRHVTAADRAREKLAEAVEPAGPADEAIIGAATLEVLKALRTAVKATGVSEDLGRRLDAQLRNLGGQLP
ncbi:hypothetical protein [Kocuria sabuli]|uniref:hypothetical protein n=1 Tax=Kocuria sabuli TaxID=3071448 RepID=UPI0034D6EDD9